MAKPCELSRYKREAAHTQPPKRTHNFYLIHFSCYLSGPLTVHPSLSPISLLYSLKYTGGPKGAESFFSLRVFSDEERERETLQQKGSRTFIAPLMYPRFIPTLYYTLSFSTGNFEFSMPLSRLFCLETCVCCLRSLFLFVYINFPQDAEKDLFVTDILFKERKTIEPIDF